MKIETDKLDSASPFSNTLISTTSQEWTIDTISHLITRSSISILPSRAHPISASSPLHSFPSCSFRPLLFHSSLRKKIFHLQCSLRHLLSYLSTKSALARYRAFLIPSFRSFLTNFSTFSGIWSSSPSIFLPLPYCRTPI